MRLGCSYRHLFFNFYKHPLLNKTFCLFPHSEFSQPTQTHSLIQSDTHIRYYLHQYTIYRIYIYIDLKHFDEWLVICNSQSIQRWMVAASRWLWMPCEYTHTHSLTMAISAVSHSYCIFIGVGDRGTLVGGVQRGGGGRDSGLYQNKESCRAALRCAASSRLDRMRK